MGVGARGPKRLGGGLRAAEAPQGERAVDPGPGAYPVVGVAAGLHVGDVSPPRAGAAPGGEGKESIGGGQRSGPIPGRIPGAHLYGVGPNVRRETGDRQIGRVERLPGPPLDQQGGRDVVVSHDVAGAVRAHVGPVVEGSGIEGGLQEAEHEQGQEHAEAEGDEQEVPDPWTLRQSGRALPAERRVAPAMPGGAGAQADAEMGDGGGTQGGGARIAR